MADLDNSDLQRMAPVATHWVPPTPQESMSITLSISVPGYASVRRNALTGIVEISDLVPADLVSLRDALTAQIAEIQTQQDAWQPL